MIKDWKTAMVNGRKVTYSLVYVNKPTWSKNRNGTPHDNDTGRLMSPYEYFVVQDGRFTGSGLTLDSAVEETARMHLLG